MICGNIKSIWIHKDENGFRKCKFCYKLIKKPIIHILKECKYFNSKNKSCDINSFESYKDIQIKLINIYNTNNKDVFKAI